MVEKPHLAELPGSDSLVIVPLRWELLTVPELQNYRVINPSRWLSGELSRTMQEELDAAWHRFVTAQGGETIEDYSYCFFTTLCPVLYWGYIIDAALAEFEPETTWLPAKAKSASLKLSSDFFRDQAKFLAWARYATLKQRTRMRSTRYFHEYPLDSASGSSMTRFINLVNYSKFRAGKLVFRKLIRELLKHIYRRRNSSSRIYIVSQRPKSATLRKLLDDASISYQFDSYSQFEKRLCPSPQNSLVVFDAKLDVCPKESLAAWLVKVIDYHSATCESRLELLTNNFSVLLHDAIHHPLVRAATRRLLNQQKHVAYFPEGAQYPSQESWPFVKNAWGNHFGETRFALSLGERDFWRANAHGFGEILVTGYFGETGSRPKVEIRRRKISQASIHRDAKVFLDQWLFSDLKGIQRPGASGFEFFPDLLALLVQLSESNIQVYSNSRELESLVKVNLASHGAIEISPLDSWNQVLAECDVLIASDSSLIVESLSHDKPVIIYQPTWLEQHRCSYSRNYQRVRSDVVRYADSPNNVVTAIYQLIASPKRDFYKYQYFLAQEQHRAVDWVKEKLVESGNA